MPAVVPQFRGGVEFLKYYFLYLLFFLFCVSKFHPFLSTYGDVQLYVNTTHFDMWNYQPVWPYLAGLVYRGFGEQVLFGTQAVMYAVSTLLIAAVAYSSGRGWCCAMLIFMAINIRSYFYIANPLTEIFNLFVFSLGIYTLHMLEGERKGRLSCMILSVFVLVLIGLTRSANVVFLVLLFVFLVIQYIRKGGRLNVALIVVIPALCVAVIFNALLQEKPNNTGINLLRFVISACEGDIAKEVKCSDEVFSSKKSPVVHKYFEANGRLSGVERSFESQGLNVWQPEFSDEIKVVYFRLLQKSPLSFAFAIKKNYLQQLTDTYVLPYPEDTNASMLNLPFFAFLNHVATSISMIVAGSAPFIVVFFLAIVVFGRAISVGAMFCLAWLASEIITSQSIFANLWISDASRMRFHYEIPGILLLFGLFSFIAIFRKDGNRTLLKSA